MEHRITVLLGSNPLIYCPRLRNAMLSPRSVGLISLKAFSGPYCSFNYGYVVRSEGEIVAQANWVSKGSMRIAEECCGKNVERDETGLVCNNMS